MLFFFFRLGGRFSPHCPSAPSVCFTMSARPIHGMVPTAKLTTENAGELILTSHCNAVASASVSVAAPPPGPPPTAGPHLPPVSNLDAPPHSTMGPRPSPVSKLAAPPHLTIGPCLWPLPVSNLAAPLHSTTPSQSSPSSPISDSARHGFSNLAGTWVWVGRVWVRVTCKVPMPNPHPYHRFGRFFGEVS